MPQWVAVVVDVCVVFVCLREFPRFSDGPSNFPDVDNYLYNPAAQVLEHIKPILIRLMLAYILTPFTARPESHRLSKSFL